jgi:hypothetical protein
LSTHTSTSSRAKIKLPSLPVNSAGRERPKIILEYVGYYFLTPIFVEMQRCISKQVATSAAPISGALDFVLLGHRRLVSA